MSIHLRTNEAEDETHIKVTGRSEGVGLIKALLSWLGIKLQEIGWQSG